MDCSICEGRCPDLWPDNYPAWELWIRVQTQWRVAPSGDLIGLDYSALYQVAKSLDIEMTRANLEKIQALEVWTLNRKRKR